MKRILFLLTILITLIFCAGKNINVIQVSLLASPVLSVKGDPFTIANLGDMEDTSTTSGSQNQYDEDDDDAKDINLPCILNFSRMVQSIHLKQVHVFNDHLPEVTTPPPRA